MVMGFCLVIPTSSYPTCTWLNLNLTLASSRTITGSTETGFVEGDRGGSDPTSLLTEATGTYGMGHEGTGGMISEGAVDRLEEGIIAVLCEERMTDDKDRERSWVRNEGRVIVDKYEVPLPVSAEYNSPSSSAEPEASGAIGDVEFADGGGRA
jgi:hypothetical protein